MSRSSQGVCFGWSHGRCTHELATLSLQRVAATIQPEPFSNEGPCDLVVEIVDLDCQAATRSLSQDLPVHVDSNVNGGEEGKTFG